MSLINCASSQFYPQLSFPFGRLGCWEATNPPLYWRAPASRDQGTGTRDRPRHAPAGRQDITHPDTTQFHLASHGHHSAIVLPSLGHHPAFTWSSPDHHLVTNQHHLFITWPSPDHHPTMAQPSPLLGNHLAIVLPSPGHHPTLPRVGPYCGRCAGSKEPRTLGLRRSWPVTMHYCTTIYNTI